MLNLLKDLNPFKKKHKMGWKANPNYNKLKLFKPRKKSEANLPQSVDLRPSFPPCYDQGDLGSCTANGIAGIIEHRMIVANYKWPFVPSRLFIYYNERAAEGTVNQDAGGMISDGIASVNTLGVCPENSSPVWSWPYKDDPNTFKIKPYPACYKNALLHKSIKESAISIDRATVLNTLAQGRPIVFGMVLFSSFESNYTLTTGIMKVPAFYEQAIGGHCMVAVGYLLNTPMGKQGVKDWILVRNSWGTDVYGSMQGYFWMPLDQVFVNQRTSSEFYVIDLMEGENQSK